MCKRQHRLDNTGGFNVGIAAVVRAAFTRDAPSRLRMHLCVGRYTNNWTYSQTILPTAAGKSHFDDCCAHPQHIQHRTTTVRPSFQPWATCGNLAAHLSELIGVGDANRADGHSAMAAMSCSDWMLTNLCESCGTGHSRVGRQDCHVCVGSRLAPQ
jgi:hypothetical protein